MAGLPLPVGYALEYHMDKWEEMFSFILHYRELTGRIPAATSGICFSPDGRDAGRWLTMQRRLYAKGKLPEDRARRLLAEGMVRMDPYSERGRYRARGRYAAGPKQDHWDRCYAAAKAWYEREGNLLIPSRYVTENGLKLGSWISMLRTMYNECPSAHRLLTPTEIRMMEDIGMVWRIHRQPSWKEWLEQVELYVEEHGDLNVPYRYEQNGFRLSNWLQSQRVNYKAGLLSKSRVESLERYGMVWSLDKRRDWDTYFELAKQFYGERGNLLIPADYYTEDGYALGPWITLQRERYKGKGAKHPGEKGLTAEEIAKLEGIGMVWGDVYALRWEMMYETAKKYYEQWGEAPKQASLLEAQDGRRIGPWVSQQRKRLRAGALDAEHVRRLSEIGITAGCGGGDSV